MTIEEAIRETVSKAIKDLGIEEFRKISWFPSARTSEFPIIQKEIFGDGCENLDE